MIELNQSEWNHRVDWAWKQSRLLYPSDHMPQLADLGPHSYKPALELLRAQRTQAFMELATGQPLPHFSTFAGSLPMWDQIQLLPQVARAIWIVSPQLTTNKACSNLQL